MLWLDRVILWIFLGSVSGISFSKLEFILALTAADEIAHLSNGFSVEELKFFPADYSSNLLRIYLNATFGVEAF
jgi:hypothetical protein